MRKEIKIEFDGALNEAGWVLVSKLQECGDVNGRQFNNMKTYLKMAIETYLNHSDQQMNIDNLATQTPEEKEALDLIDTTPHQYEMSKFSGEEWSGEGLPPVGVECWFNFKSRTPERCKVKYIGDKICVYDDESGKEYSILLSSVDFSKLETEEQREKRERLEAAYDLYLTRHIDMSAPYRYDEFLKNKFTLNGFLAIVDKTNYRKESN